MMMMVLVLVVAREQALRAVRVRPRPGGRPARPAGLRLGLADAASLVAGCVLLLCKQPPRHASVSGGAWAPACQFCLFARGPLGVGMMLQPRQ